MAGSKKLKNKKLSLIYDKTWGMNPEGVESGGDCGLYENLGFASSSNSASNSTPGGVENGNEDTFITVGEALTLGVTSTSQPASGSSEHGSSSSSSKETTLERQEKHHPHQQQQPLYDVPR